MDTPTGSRRPARNHGGASLPSTDASIDLRVVIGPAEADGSFAVSINVTDTAAVISALRDLIEPLAKSAVSGSLLRVETGGEPDAVSSRPLPVGMTSWVSADDVAHALSCSHAKAHEYLRAAAGRSIGTGHLLRVPVDIWESWARGNLVDGRRNVRTWTPSSSTTDGQLAGTSSKPKRRKLGPYSEVTSKLPMIPTLKYTKI